MRLFDYRIYTDISYSKALAQWNKDVEKAIHNNEIGIGILDGRIMVKPKVETETEALQLIEDTHKKWGDALCVPFNGGYVFGGWCSV